MGRLRWTRRRRWTAALVLAAGIGFLLVHHLARVQARGMTRFVDGGAAPARPEDLSPGAKLRLLFGGIEVPRPENGRDPGDLGLRFTGLDLEAADGAALEVWRVPLRDAAGRVLLVHGYAASKENLLREAHELHRLGWEPWLLDLRGSGGSQGDRTTLGWDEAQDVAAAVEAMPPDLPRVIYGQSMGGVATLRAIHLGLVSPDGLILEAPFDELRTTVAARFGAMGLPTWPLVDLLLWHGGWELDLDPGAFTPWTWARSVTCPTLHLYGGADVRVPVPASQRLFDSLAGPKTAHCFEGIGHVPLFGAASQAWRVEVTAFLGGL